MTVNPITEHQAQVVREWRNQDRSFLRTGWTTVLQQETFAQNNMVGDYMYWWFGNPREGEYDLNAAGGLVHIDRRVRIAEIALIVDPIDRGKGFGRMCAHWIFKEAFLKQNLKTVYGEVYACGAVSFWEKVIRGYSTFTRLPNRQYYDGKHWDGLYFSIDRDKYLDTRN